jgi:prepilin signal peptidase PulO-like enzyme (type II secretory pathway)
MGFGDVKLMASWAFLGPQAIIMALFVAVFLGAMFGIGSSSSSAGWGTCRSARSCRPGRS